MEHDLHMFFDLSLDLLCIADAEGYFTKVNPSFQRTLGWSEEELLSNPFLEFVHEDDVEATRREMAGLEKGEPTIRFTNRYRCSDGTYRTLQWTSRPAPEGDRIYAVARDLTEEQELARERNRLIRAVDQGATGVMIADPDWNVVYANPRFRRLVGWGKEPLPASATDLLASLTLPDELIEELGAPGTTVTWQDQVAMESKDRGDRWLRFSITPIQEDADADGGHLLTLEDVTDRRRAHETLVRSARAKDEFLATMSHELRTPLNAIITIAESLEEGVYGELHPSQTDALTTVRESGRHLLNLINDILDVAKIDAGELGLDRRPVWIRELCEASLRFIREAAVKKRQSLELSVEEGVERVRADERRLKQILVNLLTNAVKFTPEGGRIRLEVSGNSREGHVTFAVSDTGAGIEPGEVERLLQPFVQADSELARSQEGTGLGLTLALRLAEMHGGSLSVESEGRDLGSRFAVTLPWQAGDEEPVDELLDEELLHFRRALLVEDSAVTSDHLTRYLDELGLEVRLNRTGEGVLNDVARFRPDIVLLDLLLPRSSGWDILEELRGDPRAEDLPVLVVSVVDAPERGRALGADGFLVKPVSRTNLVEAFRAVQRERAPARQNGGGGGRPVVLLAEDNQANVTALRPFLESRGWAVEVASNGREALERSRDSNPSLILMDIQMPEMDGLEATRQIRARGEPRVPIIALTALAMPGDRERCLEAGADAYLSKPLSLAELGRIMGEVLEEEASA